MVKVTAKCTANHTLSQKDQDLMNEMIDQLFEFIVNHEYELPAVKHQRRAE